MQHPELGLIQTIIEYKPGPEDVRRGREKQAICRDSVSGLGSSLPRDSMSSSGLESLGGTGWGILAVASESPREPPPGDSEPGTVFSGCQAGESDGTRFQGRPGWPPLVCGVSLRASDLNHFIRLEGYTTFPCFSFYGRDISLLTLPDHLGEECKLMPFILKWTAGAHCLYK